jgi:pyridoxine kinase
MNQEPGVVSIQSQLVFGHAGNSAGVFPLEYAGIPVSPVPTVLFSNNPHYPSMAGDVIPPDTVSALLDALLERQPPANIRAVLSGFLGAAGIPPRIADFVGRVKARNPTAAYVLDPVMGSHEAGDVVDAATFAGIRDTLLPLADIVVPNDYELHRLTGMPTDHPQAARAAADTLLAGGAREVVVTGIGEGGAPTLDCIAVTASGAWQVETPRLPVQPVGTGDVVTALYTAVRLQDGAPAEALATAVSGTFALVEGMHERGLRELPLVQLAASLYRPPARFAAVALR